jgi:hypothetical protein
LCGGARIRKFFYDNFIRTLDSIQPLAGLSKKNILATIQNASGMRNIPFVPEIAFETLGKISFIFLFLHYQKKFLLASCRAVAMV